MKSAVLERICSELKKCVEAPGNNKNLPLAFSTYENSEVDFTVFGNDSMPYDPQEDWEAEHSFFIESYSAICRDVVIKGAAVEFICVDPVKSNMHNVEAMTAAEAYAKLMTFGNLDNVDSVFAVVEDRVSYV